jgi:hypothetical protein
MRVDCLLARANAGEDSRMDTLQSLWNDIADYMQTGFHRINALQGLLIAIGAAYFLHKWTSVFVMAVGAVLVHVILDVMIPVLGNAAAFRLPPLVEAEYWRYLLTLYVGYLLVITVFYVIKRVLLQGGARHA